MQWEELRNKRKTDREDGWDTYRQYCIDLATVWKQDYPNIQYYYVFQIGPKSRAMGTAASANRLREGADIAIGFFYRSTHLLRCANSAPKDGPVI
jgi:hypothetical protein